MSSQPRFSISSRILSPLWAERFVHHHYLTLAQCGRQNLLSTYVSKTAEVVAPSTVREDPIPSALMLESTAVC